MSTDDLIALFERHNGEYIKFERVQNKLSQRPDLHAFMLLDQLVPGNKDIIACATHDEIGLSVAWEDVAKVATEEQWIDLIRCGLRYDSGNDALVMFA